MSGGSLDYVYMSVEQVADTLGYDMKEDDRLATELHSEFVKHLYLVSSALRSIEWMLSGDTIPGDEIESIKKVLSCADSTEPIDKG